MRSPKIRTDSEAGDDNHKERCKFNSADKVTFLEGRRATTEEIEAGEDDKSFDDKICQD